MTLCYFSLDSGYSRSVITERMLDNLFWCSYHEIYFYSYKLYSLIISHGVYARITITVQRKWTNAMLTLVWCEVGWLSYIIVIYSMTFIHSWSNILKLWTNHCTFHFEGRVNPINSLRDLKIINIFTFYSSKSEVEAE